MMSSINVALPTIGRELQMDAMLLSWVAMAYVLSGAIFLLPFGKIADIYGRKKVFTYGIALFTVSSILMGVSISGKMLIFFRVFQGIGGAMTFGTGMALLVSVFPAEQRGRVLGLTVGAVYVGLSVGPFIGGFLTEQFGWRSIFFSSSLLGVVLVGSILWKIKGEWAEAKGAYVTCVRFSAAAKRLRAAFSVLRNRRALPVRQMGGQSEKPRTRFESFQT
jgi:MFS family permease